jgi:hypothetical protein
MTSIQQREVDDKKRRREEVDGYDATRMTSVSEEEEEGEGGGGYQLFDSAFSILMMTNSPTTPTS